MNRSADFWKSLFLCFTVFFASGSSNSVAHAETATYSYDVLGRLKTVVWSSGRTVTYSYDANGNRTVKVIS